MAQTGFTPLQIYSSSTTTNVPTAGNLTNSTQGAELAINIADGKLFYKDSGGVVQILATKGGVGSSTTTQVLYNSSGLIVGSSNLTFNGSVLTLNGTPPSSGTLNVVGTSGGISGAFSDNVNSSFYIRNANGGVILGADNNNIRFATTGNTAAQEIARFDTSGNFLLGTTTSPSGSAQIVFSDGSTIKSHAIPQITVLTSGSGTYTTPANCKYLQVIAIGGGAGGGGGGTSATASNGNAGGNTTFGSSLITANGGSYGAGGTATLGAGASGIAVAGANGGGFNALNTQYGTGGIGGTSLFGGNGYGAANAAGAFAQANSGSGGGGGGHNSAAGLHYAMAGGSAGGYVDAIITTPSATYSYAIGAGGNGGSGGADGFNGGTGGSGVIYVYAYF